VLVGANLSDKVIDDPAEIVCGIVSPLKLKPVACTESADMITEARPVFCMITDIVRLEPMATDPKLAEDGLNDSASWPCAVPAKNASAKAAKHTYTRRLRPAGQCKWLTELVPGETAEERFCSECKRVPCDCISQSGYGLPPTGIY
jgi:hypothetical protein